MGNEIETLFIEYRFTLADGSEEIFYFRLDARKLELLTDTPELLPSWTELPFHQCPHCPLDPDTHPHCPLAAKLVNIVSRLDRLISYDTIHVDVITEERLFSLDATVQTGISSLMGLVSATSGCPRTAFFKPMARFHLPLANAEETIFRAASMYLLAQYFVKKTGQEAELSIEGLREIYQNIRIVNKNITERLRDASTTDSLKNAVVVLDMYAFAFTDVVQENLGKLEYLFAPFLPKPC